MAIKNSQREGNILLVFFRFVQGNFFLNFFNFINS